MKFELNIIYIESQSGKFKKHINCRLCAHKVQSSTNFGTEGINSISISFIWYKRFKLQSTYALSFTVSSTFPTWFHQRRSGPTHVNYIIQIDNTRKSPHIQTGARIPKIYMKDKWAKFHMVWSLNTPTNKINKIRSVSMRILTEIYTILTCKTIWKMVGCNILVIIKIHMIPMKF